MSDIRYDGAGWVYGLQSGAFIKIGYSLNLKERLYTLQLGNPHPVRFVTRRFVLSPAWLERRLHVLLEEHAVGREWFRISIEQARAAMKQGMRDMHASQTEERTRRNELLRKEAEREAKREFVREQKEEARRQGLAFVPPRPALRRRSPAQIQNFIRLLERKKFRALNGQSTEMVFK